MDQEIISRLRKRVVQAGLDGIIALSSENVTYVSGFVVPSQSLMRWRHAICIVTAHGRISMVAIDMEGNTVKAHAGIDDLRVYGEFTEDPMDKLAETLMDLKLDRGKIGIEMEFLPVKDFTTLQKNLPAVQWVAADAIFNQHLKVERVAVGVVEITHRADHFFLRVHFIFAAGHNTDGRMFGHHVQLFFQF